MRPSRFALVSRLAVPSLWPSLPALLLAVPLLAAPGLAASSSPPIRSATPPAAIHSAPGTPASASGTLAAEKQRVPREKSKPPSQPGSASSDSNGDSGCGSSCGESCFSGGVEPSNPPPPVEAVAPAPRGWVVYDHGWLRAAAPGDSVLLFEGPVEAGRPDVAIGGLPGGAEVVVMEIHALANGIELRVRPVDRLEPLGWVAGTAISSTPPGAGTPSKPAPVLPPGWGPVRPTRWGVQLAVGGGGVLNEDLIDEYADGGFHAEAYYLNFGHGFPSDASVYWGVGVGYSNMRGNPTADYVGATEIDRPQNSNLRILDLAVEAGALFSARTGFRGRVSLGPAVFHVHENADVDTYDATMTTLLGSRVETLDRPAFGGVTRLGLGWRLRSKIELGMQIDGYLMAWNGRQQESLTTDYLSHAIGGMDIALSVTFPEP